MKELTMIVWLMQLGLNVAVPLAGYTLLAVWLRGRFELGVWVVCVGLALGIYSAIGGLRDSLKALEKLSRDENADKPVPSFNEHE